MSLSGLYYSYSKQKLYSTKWSTHYKVKKIYKIVTQPYLKRQGVSVSHQSTQLYHWLHTRYCSFYINFYHWLTEIYNTGHKDKTTKRKTWIFNLYTKIFKRESTDLVDCFIISREYKTLVTSCLLFFKPNPFWKGFFKRQKISSTGSKFIPSRV